MTNVPGSLGTTLSVTVLAIVFGIIVFAVATYFYYRKKWAAKKKEDDRSSPAANQMSNSMTFLKGVEFVAQRPSGICTP